MKKIVFVFCLAVTAQAQSLAPTTVRKIAEDFSGRSWIREQFSKATGRVGVDAEKSLKVEVDFAGKGDFEFFSATPVEPLYFPGDVQKVTLRIKRNGRGPVRIGFLDGWGRGEADGRKFQWDPKLTDSPDWQTISFDVPRDWVRPVALGGLSTYDNSTNKRTFVIQMDDIEVETDISKVDAATGELQGWSPEPNPKDKEKALKAVPATPLVAATISTPEQANVFAGTTPSVVLQVRNWTPGALAGNAVFSVTDEKGGKVKSWEQKLNVESAEVFTFPVEASRHGLYTVQAKLDLPGGTVEKQLRLASVPRLRDFTEAERVASPYGLNYHGGGTRLFEAFKKAGFIWYRDYAWGLDLMRRARGGTGLYTGWPFYPAIVQDYERLGLIPLPILGAISPPEIKEGKPVRLGPDKAWIRDIADILIAFPSIKYWELDNEYDLSVEDSTAERLVDWKNYQLYHQKFAEIADVLGDGEIVTVENGRAGIYPVFEEACVASGAFDKIGVLNSHHYTGTEPPEINYDNFNSGTRLEEGRRPGSFFDALREVKRASVADGKNRQAWLTEFGWDTLAGPVVTDEQQAAYLQRGFLMAFAAGNEKAFWFYNFDSEKPVQFFDGCGLLSHDHQPKLSFCAMAGLAKILPLPKFVGTVNAGSNTAGYVFENEGRLVAGLWTITGNAPGPKVKFEAGQLTDYLGNKLEGKTAVLGMAPVYALGLEKTDPLYLQTAYGLESNTMIVATAGDATGSVLGITNNREQEIASRVTMTLPKGWTAAQPETLAKVPPGAREEVKVAFTVGAEEKLGPKEVLFHFEENGKPLKTIPLAVMVQPPFKLEVGALEGLPGRTTLKVQVENRSASEQSGRLILKLPAGWGATTPKVEITALKPGEKRLVPMEIVWKPEWKDGESAMVVFESAGGNVTQAAVIPNHFRLPRAGSLTVDVKAGVWPSQLALPAWMLGSTVGQPDAKLWFAWAPDGLYGAVTVENSKAQVNAPAQFWSGDVLELFVSTDPNRKGTEFVEGDHQFWLVPSFKDNRVYVGQWKVKEEIAATRFDIPGVKTSSRRTPDGYEMQFFLPASVFQKYGLKPGMEIGFNANLTVRGADFDREVFWPRGKAGGTNVKPESWGRLKLEE